MLVKTPISVQNFHIQSMTQDRLFFSTYTNLNWEHLLSKSEHKDVVLESLDFLVLNKRVKVYCFVIMPNHIHLIWEIQEGHLLKNVQRDFLKFTAQNIKYKLIASNDPVLDKLVSSAKDRKFQFWERRGLSFPLTNSQTILQKFNYIHQNPIKGKWKLSESPSEYRFSSARFYETGLDEYGFLSHLSEVL